MQRPAQAKDFQLDGGDASNRRWPAGLVMARQKFGISRQCERAEETFAFQTKGRLSASGTFRTWRDVRLESVMRAKADLAAPAWPQCVLEVCGSTISEAALVALQPMR